MNSDQNKNKTLRLVKKLKLLVEFTKIIILISSGGRGSDGGLEPGSWLGRLEVVRLANV